MKCIARLIVVLLVALGVAPAARAQTQTGVVEGTVTDQQGATLPGVTATLSGDRGSQTTVTDEKGTFHFVGVMPGIYRLRVEIPSFAPQERTDVQVGMGKTATIDFTLKLSALSESIEVTAASPVVDVRSAATETAVSNGMLQSTPLYSSTATGLLNAAPGINSNSAYGGQASYGNALLLDGVDTRDPEGGSAWTFFNQNLIEEIQIGGLGAPAEYGGFSGGIINTVTKSGGNTFSGLFSIRHTSSGLASKNISSAVLQENPGLGESDITKKLNDYTVQMGGPIKQNKAFFFGSIQRYSAHTDPIGPLANATDVSPRFNFKFTLQPSAHDTLILGTQYDAYNVTGRVGYWPSSQAGDDQTVKEDAPEWVWNTQWRHVFGGNSLLEAKFTGYTGYYYLDPVDPKPFTYDAATNEYSGGGGGQYYADRSRNQVQVSLTKYAEAFGRHSLKFGAEFERSHVRSQYQPYGPAGFYIYAYGGVPYYRVSYGYDVQGNNRRTSAYAQDQWNAGRATINIGLRLDHIRGSSPVLDQTVYKPAAAWGPRLGFAYDLTGHATSAIKAFWGRYYEGAASKFFTQATPGIQDYTFTPLDSHGNVVGPPDVITPAQVYGIGADMKHPRTDEFNASFETNLMRDMRFSATGIWRKNDNFINNVIADARWSPVTLTNPLTGSPFTAYNWVNQADSNTSYTVTNTGGFQYIATDGSVIGTADATRKYKALMLLLTNNMKSPVGYQLSYVLAKAEGDVDNNSGSAYLGGSTWTSPQTALYNTYGEMPNSRRHEFKAYFTYTIPRVDVLVGGNYTGTSGRPYTPTYVFTSRQLNVAGSARRTVLLEPRGTEKNDFFNNVDVRFEKAFKVEANRFGVYADIYNLFNTATITSRQARYPSTVISGSTVAYKAPTGVQSARQVFFGARWMF